MSGKMNKKKSPFFKRVLGLITDPRRIVASLGGRGFLNWMPDALYLKIAFPTFTGYKLDLKNPKTFNEKLQWLKLHDRNPAYTQMVDKYAVRDYIARKIGEEYLIPLLGVWDRFEDIDFSQLPNQFVLKPTHDSGSVIICRDKSKLDIKETQNKINKSLKRNFYYAGREWPYKDVKPRIIAEQYMENAETHELRDYKFMCFNGEVKCSFTCTERFSESGLKVTFFDCDWKKLPFERHYPSSKLPITRPESLDQMIHLSEVLSKDIPFVRVDFYEIEGRPYFGELTLFPGCGYEEFIPESWDYTLGNWINLYH